MSSLSLKYFFLPLAGCLAAALFLNNAAQNVPECLFYSLEHSNPELIHWLKVWGRLIFSSLGTALLIFLSLKVEVQKIIRWFFIGATAGIYIYFFHLIPHFLNNPVQSASLLDNWIPASFFLLSSYWPSTIILFIYSFANRYMNVREAFMTYPVFAIFGIVIPILLIPSRNIYTPVLNTLETLPSVGQVLIILTLICFLLFEWICRKNSLPEDREKEISKSDKNTLWWQGGLVLVTAFLYQFNKSVWFSKGAVEYPAPQEYTHFLTSFEGLRSLGMLLDVVFLLFILMALENKAGRAWKNILGYIISVSLSVALCLIFYNVFNNELFHKIYLKETSSLHAFFEEVAVGSGYQIFFTAISYPILLCMKEMTFQLYAPKKRFTAKLFVDLLFAKGGILLSTLAILIGTTFPIFYRLLSFTAVLSLMGILWFYLAYRVGNKMEDLSPVSETEAYE